MLPPNVLFGLGRFLVISGLGLWTISGIWGLYVAFSTGIWWGLGYLFFPPTTLFFLIIHWKRAKGPFLLFLVSVSLIVAGGYCGRLLRDPNKTFVSYVGEITMRGLFANPLTRIFTGTHTVTPAKTYTLSRTSSQKHFVTQEDSPASLIKAVWNGNAKAVKMFLLQGADINQRTQLNGSTALMEASALGYEEIVQILIDHGADTEAKNAAGKTALDLARENGRSEIIKILNETKSNKSQQTQPTTP